MFVEGRACVLAEPGEQGAYMALGSWALAWQLTAHPMPASAQQGSAIVQGRAGPAEWAVQGGQEVLVRYCLLLSVGVRRGGSHPPAARCAPAAVLGALHLPLSVL